MNSVIYDQFLCHTGLTDALHKTIFLKLDSIIASLNTIKFVSVEYGLKGDSENRTAISFDSVDSIPVYVVDFLTNAFKDTYALPETIEGTIRIDYNNVEYAIECIEGRFILPPDLSFLKNNDLIDLILDNNRQKSLSTILMQSLIKSGTELPKVFEDLFSGTSILSQDDSNTNYKVTSNSIMIEELQAKKAKLLEYYNQGLKELSTLKDSLESSKVHAKQYPAYKAEHSSLTAETRTMQDQIEEYNNNIQTIEKVLTQISDELQILVKDSTENNAVEIDFLKNKKIFLENKLTHIESTKLQNKNFCDANKLRLLELESLFSKLSESQDLNQEELHTRIQNLSLTVEKFYNDINVLDSNIQKVQTESLQLQENDVKKTFADTIMTDALSSEVPKLLQKPQLPVPVNTIKNYLDYFEAYVLKTEGVVNLDFLQKYFQFCPELIFSNTSYTWTTTIGIKGYN